MNKTIEELGKELNWVTASILIVHACVYAACVWIAVAA